MGLRAGSTGKRALAALREDPGSSPVPTWQLTAVCNSRVRGIQHPILVSQVEGTWYTDIHACRQNMSIHIQLKVNKKQERPVAYDLQHEILVSGPVGTGLLLQTYQFPLPSLALWNYFRGIAVYVSLPPPEPPQSPVPVDAGRMVKA